MIVDPQKVADIIAEMAAEEIAPRFGKLDEQDIDSKTGPNDLVTIADKRGEEKLARALGEIYPAAGFIGEEIASENPQCLDALEGEGAFWVVDPLDGTRNFVQGRAEFGTIVALVENGEIRQGWIYAIPEETFAIASLGDGVSWAGERLRPPETALSIGGYRAIGSLREPWKSQMVPPLREHFITEPAHCSAYAYLELILGKKAFSFYSRCHPWDHAAGVLMVRELGGKAVYLDTDEAYTPVEEQGRPFLVSPNQQNWRELEAVLKAA